jgi:hypothetical protein
VLAAAYAATPGVPWVGVLLGGLLGVATVLVFTVLETMLRPYLRPPQLVAVLTLFFAVAWLEHWLWFSYVRVALLLAGAGLLFAAQRPGQKLPLLVALGGLAGTWLMRPSLAVLAFGATLPAVLLLAGHWRRALPLIVAAGVGLALATGAAALLQTPAAARTQVRDKYFARILDFEQLQPRPRTTADSLGTEALDLWLMGDTTVVNPALLGRAYHFDAPRFFARTLPAKLALRMGLLVRDYFPLLLALAAIAVVVGQRPGRHSWFWLVQLGFSGLFVLLAGVLKLPPRLELPLLNFWLLANVAFLLQEPRPISVLFRRLGLGLGTLAVVLYGAKILHRRQVLGQEQQRHELALAEIKHATAGSIRVMAGTNDLLKSLSPCRVYAVGPGPVLLLSGWQSHDPSQASLRKHLSGAAGQDACLRHLAQFSQNTKWLLSADAAQWLNRRFRYHTGKGPIVVLRPEMALAADTSLRFYQPLVQ